MPVHRVPIALRDKLKEELDRLEDKGVIRKVTEPTLWASNIVCVEKPSGKLRLCLNPLELNKALKRPRYIMPNLEEVLHELKERYYLRIIFHILDMCVTNAWILYKRHMKQLSVVKNPKPMPLYVFKSEIAKALILSKKIQSRGRPSLSGFSPKVIKKTDFTTYSRHSLRQHWSFPQTSQPKAKMQTFNASQESITFKSRLRKMQCCLMS